MVGVGNIVQNDGNIFEILGIVVRGGIISALGCIGCPRVVGRPPGAWAASLEAVEDAPEQPAREPAARQAAVNSAATDFFFIISPPKKYNYLADSRMIAGIVQKPKF